MVAEYQTRLPDKKLLQAKLHEFYELAESRAEANAPGAIVPTSCGTCLAQEAAKGPQEMTAPYRKKLIEVGLPLVAINAESAREKSIRHGHPSTLHLWWARRPLAACRAVLFSSLVDDPDSDPAFHKADGSVDEDRAGIKRADLFNFIEELVMWENSNNADVIRTARAEIARCVASRLIETGALKKDAVVGPNTTAHDLVKRGHCRPVPMGVDKKVGRVRFSFDVSKLPPAEVVNAFLAEHAPPVLDPFAGGGSIPLEAQRLGLRAYASDLNPVPVLINKALIEIPPKFAGRPPVNPASRRCRHQRIKGKGKKQQSTDREGMARCDGAGRGRAVLRPVDAGRSREADRPPVSQGRRSPPRWPRTAPTCSPTSDRNSPSSLGSGHGPSTSQPGRQGRSRPARALVLAFDEEGKKGIRRASR